MLSNFEWFLAVGAAVTSLLAALVVVVVRARDLSGRPEVARRSLDSNVWSSLAAKLVQDTKVHREAIMSIEAALAGVDKAILESSFETKTTTEQQERIYRWLEEDALETKRISPPVKIRIMEKLSAQAA